MKLQKSKRFLKKAPKLTLKTTAQFQYSSSFHDQAQEFLSKNKILYRFQSGVRKNYSGVRKNYSTNTCLGHLTDKSTTGFEKGFFTGIILIHLQKAFDTIDNQIFIKKMKYLGF